MYGSSATRPPARGHEADDLSALVEEAGHTVLGVAKQYDESTPLPNRHLDLVVAAGGDGTVATAAGIAFRTSAPLAILPLGTANNIASSLGVSAPASDAHRIVDDRAPRAIRSRPCAARPRKSGWSSKAWVADLCRPASHEHRRSSKHGRRCRRRMRSMQPSARSATRCSISRRAPGRLRSTDNGSPMSSCSLKCSTSARSGRTSSSRQTPRLQTATSTSYWPRNPTARSSSRISTHRAAGRATRLALPCHRARHVVIGRCLELHVDDERIDTCELGTMSVRIEPAAIDVLL